MLQLRSFKIIKEAQVLFETAAMAGFYTFHAFSVFFLLPLEYHSEDANTLTMKNLPFDNIIASQKEKGLHVCTAWKLKTLYVKQSPD